ncbi:hypothetical protein [Streptomyces sp. NRRL B-24484]|uniref:hypothetical protein n=1 Tax=Streptomyces sp. NRRL B-24484 TaxID=1463833 RepID=UPI00069492D5|nr:hypothetical protein [Streptomyces sp. NRRL B-24484]
MRITAGGGLDEHGIADLLAAGAPIDVFAVGTRVGVSADAPYLDVAYKLVAYDGRPMMKLSAGKATAPGAKQVFRSRNLSDTIVLRAEAAPPGTRPLPGRMMAGGQRIGGPRAIEQARAAFGSDLAALPAPARRVTGPRPPAAAWSERPAILTDGLRRRLETAAGHGYRGTGAVRPPGVRTGPGGRGRSALPVGGGRP